MPPTMENTMPRRMSHNEHITSAYEGRHSVVHSFPNAASTDERMMRRKRIRSYSDSDDDAEQDPQMAQSAKNIEYSAANEHRRQKTNMNSNPMPISSSNFRSTTSQNALASSIISPENLDESLEANNMYLQRNSSVDQGQRWLSKSSSRAQWAGAVVDESYNEIVDRKAQQKRFVQDDDSIAIAGSKVLSGRPKQRVIGNGIFISGGRVMMNENPVPPEDKITVCAFCRRTFISAHALDVHLSRNQSCRHEKDKAQNQSLGALGSNRSAIAHFKPLPPALERCRGIVLSLMKKPEASPFVEPIDPNSEDAEKYFKVVNPKSAMDLGTVLKKLNNVSYRNAREVQDDVLQIWRNCFRYYGPKTEVYGCARALSLLFDSLFDAAFDQFSGFGGRADLSHFRHGAHWIGCRVKVLWAREHDRVRGVISDYFQVDADDHIYHITYDDGNKQWATIPNKKVELLDSAGSNETSAPINVAASRPAPQAQRAADSAPEPSSEILPNSTTKEKDSSSSHHILASKEKNVQERSNVAPNAYPKLTPTVADSRTGTSERNHDKEQVKVRCPVFKESQEVEYAALSGNNRLVRAKIVRVNGNGTYDLVQVGNDEKVVKFVSEEDLRAPEGAISYADLVAVVKELRAKAHHGFFDDPVDARSCIGYYHPNPAAHQRGITAWNTQCMCFKWMEKKATMMQYPSVSAVEYDFNLITYNAVVFNSQGHQINREARILYQEARAVFAKWGRKAGCYDCKICGWAENRESPILICDYCCCGIHQHCYLMLGSRVLSLLTQEVVHPLRGDNAFFCGEDCHRRFLAITMRFKIPVSFFHGLRLDMSIPDLSISSSVNAVSITSAGSGPMTPQKLQTQQHHEAAEIILSTSVPGSGLASESDSHLSIALPKESDGPEINKTDDTATTELAKSRESSQIQEEEILRLPASSAENASNSERSNGSHLSDGNGMQCAAHSVKEFYRPQLESRPHHGHEGEVNGVQSQRAPAFYSDKDKIAGLRGILSTMKAARELERNSRLRYISCLQSLQVAIKKGLVSEDLLKEAKTSCKAYLNAAIGSIAPKQNFVQNFSASSSQSFKINSQLETSNEALLKQRTEILSALSEAWIAEQRAQDACQRAQKALEEQKQAGGVLPEDLLKSVDAAVESYTACRCAVAPLRDRALAMTF